MNKQTLNLKKITQIATEWMEKNKSHTAQAIIPIKDRMLIIALIFEGDEQKEIILNKLRTLIAEHQPKKYWIIVEVFMGTNINLRPTKDPDRTEALIISEYGKDMKNQTIIKKFKRTESGDIVWDNKIIVDKNMEMTSRWNFYKEDVMEEHITKLQNEKTNKIL